MPGLLRGLVILEFLALRRESGPNKIQRFAGMRAGRQQTGALAAEFHYMSR